MQQKFFRKRYAKEYPKGRILSLNRV